ncbi:MAG: SigB/SigF/SigG family RNA polymerase sigma factor [Micromonosporaceae bacterium]|nr:SigB/SigF/SigG family RNA polymerase sigma factor [Micromonosporaceae bacterium]
MDLVDQSTSPASIATATSHAPRSVSDHRATTTGSRSARDIPARAGILLVRLADLPEQHPDRARVRERVIELCLPLAEHLAGRFRNRGEPHDDLCQVAAIGLIKAVDGYDPARGVAFSSYAIPTIVGEIKRHYRDKGWSVRVPRALQELKLDITKAVSELTQKLQRSPTVTDIARRLGRSEEDVLTGLDAANAYSAMSLNAPASEQQGSGTAVVDLLGEHDAGMASVEDRATLRPLIAQLPEREQRIIALRFFGNLTQSEIAEKIGISQMHVSRLLTRSLRQLREGVPADH